ncbi:MAG: class I SAM-dependent methyltransferase [Anaerolineae bacterium]|nr:class I SAM-dependent methyltransferase [Anaerolineae bacterium]
MQDREPSGFEDVYFAMMAEMDFTKHLGGQQSTDELVEMCQLDEGAYVLDVGCGVGVTPCHVARAYGCQVVGVDLRAAMVQRARERAQREGVGEQTEFRVADARDLPFDDAAFDVVVCESVLAFLSGREKAMEEFARVAKPGGIIGINESTWIKEPTPELRAQVTRSFKGNLDVQTSEEWRKLMEGSGLKDVVVRTGAITAGSEVSNRLRRLGGAKGLARIMSRMPSVLVKRPVYRSFLKDAFSVPKELFSYWGYGLYVGRK